MKCSETGPLVQNFSLLINHKPALDSLLPGLPSTGRPESGSFWSLRQGPGAGGGRWGTPWMIHQFPTRLTYSHLIPPIPNTSLGTVGEHWIRTQNPPAVRPTTVLASIFFGKKLTILSLFFPQRLITKCSRLRLHFLLISCFQKYLERTLRFAVSQHSCHHHKTHGCDSYSQV